MNTGQTMISIAAMTLLSLVILNTNRNTIALSTSMAESKYNILAISLGTALIEEAFSKSFDENTTDGNLVEDLTDLTINLGTESSEYTKSNFNDFDDYNNYTDSTTSDSSIISAEFMIHSKVYYVDPNSSNKLTPAGYRTWHKRMDVFITSPFINDGQDTVVLSKVFSHYYFR